MLRIYSASGPAILRANLRAIGGHLDCLAPDSSGGVYAILGGADRSHVAFLQTLAGVTVLPNNLSANAPTLPTAATTHVNIAAPVSQTMTTGALLTNINSTVSDPRWDPNFA